MVIVRVRARSMKRVSWFRALLLAAALGAQSSAALASPRCPDALADRCQPTYNARDEHNFIVNGTELQYKFTDSGYFTLSCPEGVTLDEPALPRFDSELRVNHVEFACPLPAISYAAVLRRLNVSAPDKLTLTGDTLRGDRLAGLAQLRTLVLISVDFERNARDLRNLTGLRKLRVDETNFTTADLELLPSDLELLQLVRTEIARVPAAALARLSNLTTLLVVDSEPVQVEAVGGLRELTIQSDEAVNVSLALPDELENLTITGWAPLQPQPWKACTKLGALELIDASAEVLPGGWLASCTALYSLIVYGAAKLARLEEGALRGPSALKRLSLKKCALDALPASLLHDAPELLELDLSDNHLIALPGGLFERSRQLSELVLSRNQLDNSVLDSLEAVTSLSVLRLYGNRALDACPVDRNPVYVIQRGWSKLRNLRSLKELNLSHTNTSEVCEDWRQLPQLRKLTLSYTAITRLQRAALRFNTVNDITVELTGTNVSTLEFERTDWAARSDEAGIIVRVVLSEPLRCDCELYWAAAALSRIDTGLRVEGARCADGRALRIVPLDELVCEVPGPCPANCTCGVREDLAAGRVLRLACPGAGLHFVPNASETLAALPGRGDDYALDLRLANNRIDALRPGDMPPNLAMLDLRNNSLALIDAATAVKLVSRAGRRVWLAGNPLECGCHALAAVRSRPGVFADPDHAACAGGPSLVTAALESPRSCEPLRGGLDVDLAGAAAAAVALAIVAAAAAALALALLRPELRLRAKAALRAWGLLPRAREANDGRVYDAFVSFAHADEAVVRELVAQLEGGPTPLRLCVHYRDWAPGGWIPTQIAASVRVSRRTVAVVSAAFLRSKWARAEFREAYAAALRDAEPRLVVVLLEDPSRLQLDAELRAYLAANTYVRWGDPWFWPKLRRALPAPRRTARGRQSTSASALSDVTVRSPVMESTDALSVLSATTGSTDASVQSAATGSSNVSLRSAATGWNDVVVTSVPSTTPSVA